MKFKFTKAQVSALKTGARAFLALVVYVVLTSLKVPVELAGFLSIVTPIVVKAIDPTFKDYGVGSKP